MFHGRSRLGARQGSGRFLAGAGGRQPYNPPLRGLRFSARFCLPWSRLLLRWARLSPPVRRSPLLELLGLGLALVLALARAAGAAAQDFQHHQVQFPPRQVHAGHLHPHHVADADHLLAPFAPDHAGLGVDFPPVVHQVVEPRQAVDQVRLDLDEQAEVGHARHDALELVADVLFHQLQDLHLPQLALGRLAAAFGVADGLADFLQILRGRRAAVLDGVADLLLVFAARRADRAAAEVGLHDLEVAVEQTVDRQVRVAADRAGEVAVVLAGEGEVADELGRILGPADALEDGQVDGELLRLAADLFEQRLQALAVEVVGDLVAGGHGELLEPLLGLAVGAGVDAPHVRHAHPREQARHGLVGLDHEHLDQRVRERVVLLLGVHDLTVLVQHQVHLRQVEVDLPRLPPPRLDELGERVHLVPAT